MRTDDIEGASPKMYGISAFEEKFDQNRENSFR